MTPEEIAAMKAENDKLKADLEKLKTPPAEPPAPPTKPPGDAPDLRAKAKDEKDAAEKKNAETKQIELAVTFNVGIDSFLKENADVLPQAMADIVKQADKETYDSKIERANVIKAAWVQEFFSVQANVDLLTKSQKAQLDDYLKLTKAAKEQKADSIYENIFEPTLETLKKVKKAEELVKARNGIVSPRGVQDAMVKNISKLSQQFYLGKKEAA